MTDEGGVLCSVLYSTVFCVLNRPKAFWMVRIKIKLFWERVKFFPGKNSFPKKFYFNLDHWLQRRMIQIMRSMLHVRWWHATTNPERPLFHLRMPNRCANYLRGRDTMRWVVYLGWMPLKEGLACEGRLKLRLSSMFHQCGNALTQRIKGTSEITGWWLCTWK